MRDSTYPEHLMLQRRPSMDLGTSLTLRDPAAKSYFWAPSVQCGNLTERHTSPASCPLLSQGSDIRHNWPLTTHPASALPKAPIYRGQGVQSVTLPAVLQAGKLMPREERDLFETSESQSKALPTQQGVTQQHMLCVWNSEGKEPICQSYFSYGLQPPKGLGLSH